jgi:hypothetical protein
VLRAVCGAQGEKQPAFVEYIKTHWVKKLSLWVKGSLKDIDHSDAFTNAAIEAYHRVLKDLQLKGRKRLSGRRLDWLINTLLSKAITHYWCVHMICALHGSCARARARARARACTRDRTHTTARVPPLAPCCLRGDGPSHLRRYKQERDQRGRAACKAQQRQAAAAEDAAEAAVDSGSHTDTPPPPTDPAAGDGAAAGDSAAQQLPTGAGSSGSQQHAQQHRPDPERTMRAVEEVLSDLRALMQRGEELAKAAGERDTHHVWGVALRGLRSVRESAAAAVALMEAGRQPAQVPAPFLTAPGAVAGQSLKRMAPACSPSHGGHRAVARARAAEAKASEQQGNADAQQLQQPQQPPQPPQLPQPFLQVLQEPKKRKRTAAAAQSVGELSAEWATSAGTMPNFYRWLKERGVEETVRTPGSMGVARVIATAATRVAPRPAALVEMLLLSWPPHRRARSRFRISTTRCY